MADPKNTPAGSQPPPNATTYRNPRRTSPENSITLRHHRLARETSRRPPVPPHIPAVKFTKHTGASPRRDSSGESGETGDSDPRKWFDGANANDKGDVDTSAMDVDPPFYQRETDSSNEEVTQGGRMIPSQSPAYRFVQNRPSTLRPGITQSSSADDFRSVIDDLTIENKRLRDELKRYRQMGPDSMRREKLFEVKVHGLPSQRKRELEAALRDFTQSLDGSSNGTPNRKKNSGKSKNMSSGMSKHASSSSGSNSRPVDSAYASMSGPSSSVPSLPTKGGNSSKRSVQKIENYLRDIPEGLWPRATFLNEKEKKKLVVKRLEHLFTGKMPGFSEIVPGSAPVSSIPPPISEDVEMQTATFTSDSKDQKPAGDALEPSREAQIRPHKLRAKEEHHSRDEESASNSRSRDDQTDSRDNGNGSGSGSGHGGSGAANGAANVSPPEASPTEQRPTRPRDLDPDRKQVPADNMDYIRHLGIKAPESQKQFSSHDVSPDAEGWVYLNLLCNLAQLHILNVTPDFIRSAVSEKSTKFQLSPDGRKIRWRGGKEGTKFSSEGGSGTTSQNSQSSDDTDGANTADQRKKQKTQTPSDDVIQHKGSNFKPQVSDTNSSESFHYKPLFVHQQSSSSDEQPSVGDETGSSYGPQDDSNLGGGQSRWGQSGVSAGVSQRKRRRDGAIIYYSGAPFCTDLSGDYGEVSPDTYGMTSSGERDRTGDPISLDMNTRRPLVGRSSSGSSLPFRPLSDRHLYDSLGRMDVDGASDVPDLTSAETESEDSCEFNLEWSNKKQYMPTINLEASGLWGIYPEDHFIVLVATQRMTNHLGDDDTSRPGLPGRSGNDSTAKGTTPESITGKLASMTTSSPVPLYVANATSGPIDIEYMTAKFRKLPPVPLPPPSFYVPPIFGDDNQTETTSGFLSRRFTDGAYADEDDLSGNDEEDEHSAGEDNYDASGSISPADAEELPAVTELGIPIGQGRSARMRGLSKVTGSSAATAGGAGSGYNSSMEEA